jgi:hypothetical protein
MYTASRTIKHTHNYDSYSAGAVRITENANAAQTDNADLNNRTQLGGTAFFTSARSASKSQEVILRVGQTDALEVANTLISDSVDENRLMGASNPTTPRKAGGILRA